jgi:hypothetical protein
MMERVAPTGELAADVVSETGRAWRPRLVAGAVALTALGVLLAAAVVQPSPEGHGSHTQLGLPPCGWAMVSGTPCPTCGMTTAFAHAVRGELGAALICQPMGLLLAVGAAAAFWAGLHIAITGSEVWRVYSRLLTPRMLWIAAALTAAAWIYKWATWGPG